MSTNPDRSRLARIAGLLREAGAAEAAGRTTEAVSLLREVVRLDPRDRRTLHRLGDVLGGRLDRPAEAAEAYAREARVQEEEGFLARAIAAWRLALRCDPGLVEGHERIGALYLGMGRPADARLHYERAADELRAAGLAREAAIVRAHLAAMQAPEASAVDRPATGPLAAPRSVEPEPPPDATALDLAADRLQNGRVFHHYGLHDQARQQLEELLASLPEHVEARQLLVEVCRVLGDAEAASQHLRVLTHVMRRRGEADRVPARWELPPIEEWVEEGATDDPLASLLGEIREDVERLVDRLSGREEEE